MVAGVHPVRELLVARRRLRQVVIAEDAERGALTDLADLAAAAGVTVERAPRDKLDVLAQGVVHQGVVALAPPFPYRSLSQLVPTHEPAFLVAVDGVTDPHNVGSIARSAEGAGAHGLVLPERRAAGVTIAAEKAAAGAFAHLPVAQVTNLPRALGALGEQGVWSVGLAEDGEQSLWECDLLTSPVVLVIGSEGVGLSRLVRERCDVRVRIPLRGAISSLNASVAAALALFETSRRRGGHPVEEHDA